MSNQSAANPSSPKRGRAVRLAVQTTLLGALCLGVWIAPAFAADLRDIPREDTWMTDGIVRAIARTTDTIYLGGYFSYVGPYTGSGAPVSASTGQLAANFPKVDGDVYACVADGVGGWFIGGEFTRVGGVPRNSLAHILADGSLDLAWNPNTNGRVHALAISGSTVYAAGWFTSIGGQARNYIAALDGATGNATAWNPNPEGEYSTEVNALAVSGSTVYVGGWFKSIGGQPRNNLAALDGTTGNTTAWNPNSDGNVTVLAISGSTVYAAGYFGNIGGQPRKLIAALDAVGNATPWNPSPSGLEPGSWYRLAVCALAVSGSTIYAGGNFTSIGGQERIGIAALDASTGGATAWNPNPNGWVFDLAVSGSTVYAGGTFTSIGGQTRNHLAALDASTGAAIAWNPNVNAGAYKWVYTLAAADSTVYVGGNFTSIGGQNRNGIAALDAMTGNATAWNPNADDQVFALAISGSTVYVGGYFTSIGGQARNYIAALDVSTGAATAWNPNASGGGEYYEGVYALAVLGSTVYAGGHFNSIGGQTRNYIAALDASTGAATAWNPNASGGEEYDGGVHTLAVSGSTIYAGGHFDSIGGQTRNNIAALDVSTGNTTPWNPNANGWVEALAVSDSTVYAGGYFTSIGGQTRNWIAALDGATGNATPWSPNASGGEEYAGVYALAVSGSTVYAGGKFTNIGGQPRNYIAALDIETGNASDWNPNAGYSVYALTVSGSTVYVGGYFWSIRGQKRCGFAQFDAIPPSSAGHWPLFK